VAAALMLTAAEGYSQGIITTVAGGGKCCTLTDGSQATNVWLTSSNALAMDKQGNLYIWETQADYVRKVSPSGIITTVAGNGTAGFAGDGGPALSAELSPIESGTGLAVDSSGNLYISDGYNQVIRKVTPAGIISTIAGSGQSGFSGDGGPATKANLFNPGAIAVDGAGNLYIADTSNYRVRKVSATGVITTVAGNGNVVDSGDNVPATSAAIGQPGGITVDGDGNLFISESGRVRKVNLSGTITTVAGPTKKASGFSGDGGPATAATLAAPLGLAVDSFGNVYIADSSNGRIRKVDAAGIITTYAGITGNSSTPIGDGGAATSAYLGVPKDVVLDPSGNLYIVGSAAGIARVRKVAAGTGAGFVATPPSLSFAFTIGGTAPAAQSVALASSGTALSYTAAPSTASGGSWLSVSPSSGTTPANITVSVNPQGLAGGSYQGTITVTPGGAENSPLAYNVTLTVAGAGAPAITTGGIVNASGYQAKLAPDTVFVIFGNNLGPAALVAGSPNYQSSLSGTSIAFTPVGGGATTAAKMIYTYATQVAGLLPSSITPGTYQVQVTYQTLTSAPQTVTVVARSFGIATSNSAGSGTAQATIGNVNGGLSLTRFTPGSTSSGGYTWTLTPAHPGDTIVLWGTGGGADAANDAGGTSGDQTAAGNFQVTVDGRQITPLYTGASQGYPGLWQMNFQLPADMTPDCFASAQVSAGGELSNSVNIPIAAAGAQQCSDPSTPPAVLSKLDAGANITVGAFGIAKIENAVNTQETASGSVFSFSPAEWITLNSGPLSGSCRVFDRTYAVGGKDPGSPDRYLDAGAKLPLSGPNVPTGYGLGAVSTANGPAYAGSLTAGTLTAGTYMLTGTGGTEVGSFSASTVFPASFAVTGWDGIASINRSAPFTFTWSGSGFDNVAVVLSTTVVSGGTQHLTTINCSIPAADGSYTIPAAALGYLSQVPASGTSFGTLSIQGTTSGQFTANLVKGGQLDIGTFGANLGAAKNVALQ
jgi:uncharacterized protein (TIGR03437 family)